MAEQTENCHTCGVRSAVDGMCQHCKESYDRFYALGRKHGREREERILNKVFGDSFP